MMTFDKVMFKISLEIEKIIKENRKIKDKEMAFYLDIKQDAYATMKHREVIPYKQIIEFCLQHNISINGVFND